MPVILQYILVLTYIALIFSVSTTINSLILTRYFGNIPMLVERFQEKTRSVTLPSSEFPSDRNRSREYITPWGWRLLECHCTYDGLLAPAAETLTSEWPLAGLFTLVISVLCLPAQILLYIWTQEKCAIRAAVSVAGVFAMLPILHFLPFFQRGTGTQGKSDLAPLPRHSSWMVLIATWCLPLYTFPLQFMPFVLHTNRVIEILYHIIHYRLRIWPLAWSSSTAC